MIRITIEIGEDREGNTSLLVSTEPFDPKEQSDDAGTLWIGISTAINSYVRSNGMPEFDCLKAHPLI
jgi:hypothetical protein